MALARVLLACVLLTGLAACDSGEGDRRAGRTPAVTPSTPRGGEPVSAEEERTIRGWSDTLRHGDIAGAARSFALPSVVANGSPLLRLRTRAQAEQFNRALPCGARVVTLERGAHHFVIATFRLTERPGAGRCGSGTGGLARTAFRIRDRRITLWLRLPLVPEQGSEPSTPS